MPLERWLSDSSIDLRRLRDWLAVAGYTAEGIHHLVRPGHSSVSEPVALEAARWRTRTGRPLDTMVRLFQLGDTVASTVIDDALGSDMRGQLEAVGLLTPSGDGLRSEVQIRPFGNLLLAADRYPMEGHALPEDHVLSIGAGTRALADLAIDAPGGDVLDLGTGCGAVGLAAAARCRSVLATDLNPRAVAMTALNARMNRLANVETATGSLFDPARGRRFDRILTNPPFVVTPGSDYTCRDSGMPADSLCRALVQEAPYYLKPGGYLQMLCNWIHPAGQEWRERLAGWFADNGCDSWVLRSDTLEPEDYASIWVSNTERGGPAEKSAAYRRWVAHYDAERITAISSGVIVLRKRDDGRSTVRIDDWGSQAGPGAGAHLMRCMVGAGMAAEREDLAGLRLACAGDTAVAMELRPEPDGWATTSTRLRLTGGMGTAFDVPPQVGSLFTRFRKGCTVAEAMEAEGLDLGSMDEVRQAVARLLSAGFLEKA